MLSRVFSTTLIRNIRPFCRPICSSFHPIAFKSLPAMRLQSLNTNQFVSSFATNKLKCITERTPVKTPILVIGAKGEQLGLMNKEDALKVANDQELDLVIVHYQEDKVVCKLQQVESLEYKRKKKEQKMEFLNRKQGIEKEIRIRGKISPHDLMIKLSKVDEFLSKNIKVRISFKDYIKQKRTLKTDEEPPKLTNEQYIQLHPHIKPLLDSVYYILIH
ncbi:hypothetical protein WA158_004167 [Blastocystis sp. Blastoise]